MLKFKLILSSFLLIGITHFAVGEEVIRADELNNDNLEQISHLIAQATSSPRQRCGNIQNAEEYQQCVLKTPSFFEEPRKIQPQGFEGTFLNDALNGVSDPLSGQGGITSRINTTFRQIDLLNVSLDTVSFLDGDFDVDASIPPVARFSTRGQINPDGNFTFNLNNVRIPPGIPVNSSEIPSIPVTFFVGTTGLVFDNPIDVRESFIRAVQNNPIIQQELQNRGIILPFLDGSRVESATVTPRGAAANVPIHVVPGGFVFGSLGDR